MARALPSVGRGHTRTRSASAAQTWSQRLHRTLLGRDLGLSRPGGGGSSVRNPGASRSATAAGPCALSCQPKVVAQSAVGGSTGAGCSRWHAGVRARIVTRSSRPAAPREDAEIAMKTAASIFTLLLLAAASAQAQKPTTGYAPINGLRMYYEDHGSGTGAPLVLLHGSFMTITNNWTGWIGELSKARRVIAVEMQGHGRTADIARDFSHESLADDIAALLDYLEIERADLLGYSMVGSVAMQAAIRHPRKVRKVVSVSAVFRHDGWVKEALDMFQQLTADTFKGSPIETEYKKLSPTPNEFPKFVKRVIAMDLKPY